AALASYLGRLLSAAGGSLVAREKDLENLGALHRQILASMPSGLITCSATGRVTFVNRAGAALLELETWHSADISAVLPGLEWRHLDGKRREVEIPTQKGAKTLGLTVTGLDTPPGSALIVFQDLTHMRRMEIELRRADQLAALGRMSAQLAHEIKNPLASMRGSAQLLAEDVRTGLSARLAQILIRESDRLTSLVDAFLKFARPPEPKRQELALEKLVRDCLEMLSSDPLSKDVPIEFDVRPVSAMADPDQLRQVLINLLRNAFEAVKGLNGSVRVRLSEAGEMARLEIWDSAGTIAEPHLRRLFEPFFTTRPGGTGLGLSISYSIIQAHGGNIQVSSSLSGGTCFTVLIPLTQGREL
ncbi:MAG: ATP-binding protein, partial [Gemmatimonadota bacterium]|nr:ATP-binding protein [Gemmatimonadota bacterium]